jgi:hypothetical protein
VGMGVQHVGGNGLFEMFLVLPRTTAIEV